MTMQNTSTLSKVNKSQAWKQAKRQRSIDNKNYRADLHRQKASTGSIADRATIQGKIDEMSKRG